MKLGRKIETRSRTVRSDRGARPWATRALAALAPAAPLSAQLAELGTHVFTNGFGNETPEAQNLACWSSSTG